MCEEMKTLVSRLTEYLKRSEQQLKSFHTYESQVEGWFKGELLCFLNQEKLEGRLPNFGRERQVYKVDEKYILIDMALQFESGNKWVELKHWIGYQNNTRFTPSWYFKYTTKSEVEKLLTIPGNDDKFMLVLFTPNPDPEDWRAGVEEFNTNFSPLCVRSLTNPSDCPSYFFLGLLRVCPKEASTL